METTGLSSVVLCKSHTATAHADNVDYTREQVFDGMLQLLDAELAKIASAIAVSSRSSTEVLN